MPFRGCGRKVIPAVSTVMRERVKRLLFQCTGLNIGDGAMSKVAQPVHQKVFLRHRLFKRLDDLRHFPLIWVCGPAGSGKTTLVSSYIANQSSPCLWYQLDQGDADIASFFFHLGQAVPNDVMQGVKPLPHFTPEYQRGLSIFTRRFFDHLYGLFANTCILVFDNYNEVPPSAVMHDVLLQAILSAPRGVNAIVISREEPPPNLVRLEVDHLIGFLDWENLRMSMKETEGFLGVHDKGGIPQETIRCMHGLTDGWAAGLILLSNVEQFEKYSSNKLLEYSKDKIFAYFAFEVFRQLEEPMKEFFLTTAWLPKMTESMAIELSGNHQAGSILRRLSRSNFFLVMKQLDPEPIYEYHQLFREFLCAHANEKYEPDDLRSIITKAAHIMEQNGQVEAAINLILDTRDWGTMTHFLFQHGKSMLKQGRHHSLKNWLDAAPAAVLQSCPWLLYWLGMCTFYNDPIGSMKYFEAAYSHFRRDNDVSGFFWTWTAMANVYFFGYFNESHIDQLIRDFEDRREEFDSRLSEQDRAMVAGGMFGMLGFRKPDHPDIESWYVLARTLVGKAGSADDEARILLARVYYLLSGGKLEQALRETEVLCTYCQLTSLSEVGQVVVKVIESVCFCFSVQHEQCISAIQDGLEIARKSGVHGWDTLLICHGVMTCINVGDREGAAKYMDQLITTEYETRPFVSVMINLVKSRYALKYGRIEDSINFAGKVLAISQETDMPYILCWVQVWYAQVSCLFGDETQCDAFFNQSEPLISRLGNDGWLNPIFLHAYRLLNCGQKEAGLNTLKQAFQQARGKGYHGPLWDAPDMTADLCAQALEHDIEAEYVKKVILKRRFQPDERHLTLESWPWPVKIYTLGRFSILKDGLPAISSRKNQLMPIVMLKMLISLGGRDVRADQIADLLWPNADGDLAHRSLEITIHRLRRLLGNPETLLLREGRLSLNARICWVDAWAFERLLKKSDEYTSSNRIEQALELIEKTLGLYKGPYLGKDLDEPWMYSTRERLRSKFLRKAGWLARQKEIDGQWEQAADCYERCLDVDDCVEELYRRLMHCYQVLGRHGDGLRSYQRCKKTLEVLFEIEPSPETQAAYNDLLVSQRAKAPHLPKKLPGSRIHVRQ
jgi:LuxR family transcriptional regulator, maltose regulon positive regulatory protein